MKIFTLFLIVLVVFAVSPVFACGGSSGEDKEEQSFTIDTQYLCATCGCTKKAECKPEKEADSDDDEKAGDEAEDSEEAKDQCGGDKDKEPEAMCGGSGCGKDKDETEA